MNFLDGPSEAVSEGGVARLPAVTVKAVLTLAA